MTARTVPTMPTWSTNQQITSTLLNQITAYAQFWANRPSFRMFQAVVQTPASSTLTQITMDTPAHDSDSGRSAGTPWSYTIPTGMAGWWQFTGCVAWNASATGARATVIYQNGAQAPGAYVQVLAAPAAFVTSVTCTATFLCNAGDTISVWGQQASGGGLATYSSANIYSYFEGQLLSLGSP